MMFINPDDGRFSCHNATTLNIFNLSFRKVHTHKHGSARSMCIFGFVELFVAVARSNAHSPTPTSNSLKIN